MINNASDNRSDEHAVIPCVGLPARRSPGDPAVTSLQWPHGKTDEITDEIVAKLLEISGGHERFPNGSEMILTVGTVFSGADQIMQYLESASVAIEKRTGCKIIFRQLWACDSDGPTQQFLKNHTAAPKIFSDASQLVKGKCFDVRSGDVQEVEDVDIGIGGFSCKDASSQSTLQVEHRGCIEPGHGSTGSTFHFFFNWVRLLVNAVITVSMMSNNLTQ